MYKKEWMLIKKGEPFAVLLVVVQFDTLRVMSTNYESVRTYEWIHNSYFRTDSYSLKLELNSNRIIATPLYPSHFKYQSHNRPSFHSDKPLQSKYPPGGFLMHLQDRRLYGSVSCQRK